MEYFRDELELLKASYDASEMEFCISSNSPILKFILSPNTSMTFEITPLYPQEVPLISVTSSEMTNSEKSSKEYDIRFLATELIGSPMIMELVTKMQNLLKHHNSHSSIIKTNSLEKTVTDVYMALMRIDHMRHKSKYSKTLLSWANDLNIFGALLFCQKWIFLILQGEKNNVKEFIIKLKTVPVDVDSSGKPCKEKMSKILFEGEYSNLFSSFIKEEFSSVKEMESYFKENNLAEIYRVLEETALKGNCNS